MKYLDAILDVSKAILFATAASVAGALFLLIAFAWLAVCLVLAVVAASVYGIYWLFKGKS